jgi:hypothetical protein
MSEFNLSHIEFTPDHLTSVEGNEAAQARLQLVRDYRRRIEAEGSLPALEALRNEFWQSLELHHFDKQELEPIYANRVRVVSPPRQY